MYSKQAIVAEPAGALSVSALENYKHHIKVKQWFVSLVVVIMILIE